MKKLNDPVILDRFKNGDKSAFEEIVLTYQDNIYSLCCYMLGDTDTANDAAQETFLKAYQNLKNFRPNASIYTWLYRIAVNTCIDYKRKSTFETRFPHTTNDTSLIEEQPSVDPSPEKSYESKQITDALNKALNKLSLKLKTIIVMKEVEGLSYEEIADILDISIGTVKSRISRAREELKKLIKGFTQ